MKKLLIISFITAALTTMGIISYADTLTGSENAPVTQQSNNTHADNANTTTDQKTTTIKTDTSKQQTKQNSDQENNPSLYDNIRWGWNKFIDVLAGPKQ